MAIFDPHADSATALTRIAEALERLSPPPGPAPDLTAAEAFVWRPSEGLGGDQLTPVPHVARIDLDLLIGVDRARNTLLANTEHFAAGLSGQQRPVVGRARDGEILVGEGGPRRHQPTAAR